MRSAVPSFDASNSQCLVRVYREGIAAAVGHDLVLEVGEFVVDVDPESAAISARFQADSLRVLGTRDEYEAEKDARDSRTGDSSALSKRDKRKIERNLRGDVLQTKRFPVITFESAGGLLPAGSASNNGVRVDSFQVRGQLGLHGVEREVEVEVQPQDTASVARARVHQPDFEIAPFRALMGALKIKADVDVELRIGLNLAGLAGRA
jgi:hypothetical protein